MGRGGAVGTVAALLAADGWTGTEGEAAEYLEAWVVRLNGRRVRDGARVVRAGDLLLVGAVPVRVPGEGDGLSRPG
jgi:hypothetical protein